MPLLNADNSTAAASFFAPRSSSFDAVGDGVAYWSLYSAALNSGLFCSWSSKPQPQPQPQSQAAATEGGDDEGDAMAWRVYAERGTFAGITPPSVSAAYYRNGSSYAFDYLASGFVAANVAAGPWDTLQTLSLLSAFEFADADGDGRYDPATDSVLSEFDLATLLWDTPCASAGRGDRSVAPAADSNTFSFRSRLFNPAFSSLQLTMVLEQGGGVQQATMPAGGEDATQGLVVSSRNVALALTLQGFHYTSPTSMLGLRFGLLTSRSTANSSVSSSAIDLTGRSGVGGTGFNESLGPVPTHLRNALTSGAGFDAAYVAWQRSSSSPSSNASASSSSSSSSQVNVSLCALTPGDLTDFKGANAQMFLAGSPPRYNVDVQNVRKNSRKEEHETQLRW